MTQLKDMQTPIFAAEGILHLNREDYRLQVTGLVTAPQQFTLTQIQEAASACSINCRLTSVSGWSVRTNWDGITWQNFLQVAAPTPQARYVLFASAQNYTTVAALEDLHTSHSLLAWGVGGQPLEDEYGGPLRLLIPNLWGYKSCKWVTEIRFIEKYISGYWELRGYTHRGLIEPGETFDVNTKQYRFISGGEVTEF